MDQTEKASSYKVRKIVVEHHSLEDQPRQVRRVVAAAGVLERASEAWGWVWNQEQSPLRVRVKRRHLPREPDVPQHDVGARWSERRSRRQARVQTRRQTREGA